MEEPEAIGEIYGVELAEKNNFITVPRTPRQ